MKIHFDNPKKDAPTYEGGMKVPYAPAKRALSAWRWYLVIIITASPLIFFMGKIAVSYVFNSAPAMVNVKSFDLNSPESATVSKILAKIGDEVKTGVKIAELSDSGLNEQISLIESDLDTLKRGEAVKRNGSMPEASLRLAQKVLDQRSENLKQVRYLFSKGAATIAELNLARAQYNQAELEVARAQNDLVASGGSDYGEAMSRAERLKKELEVKTERAGKLFVSSPFTGVLSDLYITENQSIAKGSPVARVSIPGEYSIKAYVDTSKLESITKGKKVTLRFPGAVFIRGFVSSEPKKTSKLPPEISESFYETRQTIEVMISTEHPIPREFQIDGLPLKVYFGIMFF